MNMNTNTCYHRTLLTHLTIHNVNNQVALDDDDDGNNSASSGGSSSSSSNGGNRSNNNSSDGSLHRNGGSPTAAEVQWDLLVVKHKKGVNQVLNNAMEVLRKQRMERLGLGSVLKADDGFRLLTTATIMRPMYTTTNTNNSNNNQTSSTTTTTSVPFFPYPNVALCGATSSAPGIEAAGDLPQLLLHLPLPLCISLRCYLNLIFRLFSCFFTFSNDLYARYLHSVDQAERAFKQLFPDELFLPPIPGTITYEYNRGILFIHTPSNTIINQCLTHCLILFVTRPLTHILGSTSGE